MQKGLGGGLEVRVQTEGQGRVLQKGLEGVLGGGMRRGVQ